MLWNIEGLKNATSTIAADFLEGYDAAIFTETFLTDQWQHSEYYSAYILAKQGERGRPQGGITVLLKPWMAPIISTTEQNHSLLIVSFLCSML